MTFVLELWYYAEVSKLLPAPSFSDVEMMKRAAISANVHWLGVQAPLISEADGFIEFHNPKTGHDLAIPIPTSPYDEALIKKNILFIVSLDNKKKASKGKSMSFIKSESIGSLVAALLKAKETFDPILKQSENPFFKKNGQNSKYADLGTAIKATESSLATNGLAISQFPVNDGDRVGVLTLLVHISGEYFGESFTLALGDKQNAQTGVAAVTYARRTGYLAVIGVAAEDDDGNTAAGRTSADDSRSADEMPDFQSTQRGHVQSAPAPRPAAAPKAQPASRPAPAAQSAAKASAPAPATPSAGPSPTEVQLKLNDTPAVAEREPGDEPTASGDHAVPNEEELKPFRVLFQKLGDDLSTLGKLKSSKGLPINRKLLVWLLAVVGAADAKEVTIGQWKKFFSRVDATKAQFGDEAFVKLTGLVNAANGIEVAAKK